MTEVLPDPSRAALKSASEALLVGTPKAPVCGGHAGKVILAAHGSICYSFHRCLKENLVLWEPSAMGRLLVSVRGPVEAVAAAKGGAHIADVEYPASALGTPYPLNIKAVRQRLDADGFAKMPISTNIGEDQLVRSTACQAALGVAVAGADYVKCGFAGLDPKAAAYLGRNLVRTLREWCPECEVYPAVFPEEEFAISFDPLTDGPKLVEQTECDGLLIDTFRKDIGKGLLDHYDLGQLEQFVTALHAIGKEAWLAGSIVEDELSGLWKLGTDVICVRGAACDPRSGDSRFGTVRSDIVHGLVETQGAAP